MFENWPYGWPKPRKYKAKAWCKKGGQMATAAEHAGQAKIEDGIVTGWECPECHRVLILGEWRTGNCDVKGWQGVRGARWPRHYVTPTQKSGAER